MGRVGQYFPLLPFFLGKFSAYRIGANHSGGARRPPGRSKGKKTGKKKRTRGRRRERREKKKKGKNVRGKEKKEEDKKKKEKKKKRTKRRKHVRAKRKKKEEDKKKKEKKEEDKKKKEKKRRGQKSECGIFLADFGVFGLRFPGGELLSDRRVGKGGRGARLAPSWVDPRGTSNRNPRERRSRAN